jgi:hypothetical protein
MNPSNDNTTSNETVTLQAVKKERHVILYENITLSLSPFALKLYLIFRYETDYSMECSAINKKIKFFTNKSGLTRTRTFECLQELEEHGLIKRESKAGEQTKYWIADKLNYFTPKEIDQPPVRISDDPVQHSDDPVRDTDTIINNSFNNSSQLNPIVDFQSTKSYKDDELFMMFYSSYPNKQKPEIARKAFYKHKPDAEFALMLSIDVARRMDNNWKNRHKNKIPFPATYLNGKEWEGEIYPAESNISTFPNKPKRFDMDELTAGIL